MRESGEHIDRGNHRKSVEEVKEFLEGRGKLLDPGIQDFFSSQIALYDALSADINSMSTLRRHLPFMETGKKSSLRTSKENIEYAFQIFGKFADMFDNTESLPRVATEMAKWGADEFLSPLLVRKKGDTLGDREKAFSERRSKWFGGLEKMMRAAEAWRMLLSVNDTINSQNPITKKLEGTEEEKIKFVSKIYEFMEQSGNKSFEDFADLLDSYFVTEDYKPDVRKERLELAKDQIKKTDGYTFLDIAASKYAKEIDGVEEQPMFYEYLYMVVSGKTERYSKVFSERLKVIARRENKENPDAFVPQIWAGVANETDVKEGLADKPGQLIKVKINDIKDKNGNLKPWYERKLREIGADAYLDDQNEGAIWLAMEVDLSKVLGNESAFADYARKIGAVEKSLVTIAVPVSVSEAKILAQTYAVNYSGEETGIDTGSRTNVRDSLIEAYANRMAGLVMWHGFGADEEVYLTPSWAQAAYNAALPETGKFGNLITEKSVNQKQLTELLSGRLCGVIINVLGGKGTGVDVDRSEEFYNTAGSMERASWYVLEAQRSMSLVPGAGESTFTIDYAHSMGAQVGERLSIILPESARSNMHIIYATEVNTSSKEINTFMHGNPKNVLGDVVIQSRHSKHAPVASIGRGMAAIGRATRIDKSIINDMIIPPDASDMGTDARECRAMISVHERIYNNEDDYIARQRLNLEAGKFAFAQFGPDELHLTAGIAANGNATALIGEYDEVLSPAVQKKNYRKFPTVYTLVNFTGKDWKNDLDVWADKHGVPIGPKLAIADHQTQVLVGNFAHYLNVNRTGRYFIKSVLRNLLKRHKVLKSEKG